MEFTCKGHPNVRSTHKTTLEFTHDADVSRAGDCIVGVSADYDVKHVIAGMKGHSFVRVYLFAEGIEDSFEAHINHSFSDEHEMVFRKTDFVSDRTLGTNATKAAKDLLPELVETLKNPETRLNVRLEFYGSKTTQ